MPFGRGPLRTIDCFLRTRPGRTNRGFQSRRAENDGGGAAIHREQRKCAGAAGRRADSQHQAVALRQGIAGENHQQCSGGGGRSRTRPVDRPQAREAVGEFLHEESDDHRVRESRQQIARHRSAGNQVHRAADGPQFAALRQPRGGLAEGIVEADFLDQACRRKSFGA